LPCGKQGVDLKRVPPKSRPTATPNRLLHSRKRSAGTPPSTFLFLPIHFSNSPERRMPPPRMNQGAVEAGHPARLDALPTESRVDLQGRAIAPMCVSAPKTCYIRGGAADCQHSNVFDFAENRGPLAASLLHYMVGFSHSTMAANRCRRAVVKPHSSAVLSASG
jgi:hypothetical protein